MTLEEYLALLEAQGIIAPGAKQRGQLGARALKQKATIRKKRTGKKDPKMARALKKANSMMRTKSGKLRKGATQAKIMKKAHQLRRKM